MHKTPANAHSASEQLAAALLNVKASPQGQSNLKEAAAEARAYDRLKPYPEYGFKKWKIEDLGPLPRCMPLPKRIVRRGARFLFGKGIEIKCPGNPTLEEFLRGAWVKNQMPTRAVAMAQKGAIEGNIALKFSYDPADTVCPLSIQTLSLVDQVRFFYHPHNRQKLLMARVQYRYFDPMQNSNFWYREEWTDAEFVRYKPIPDGDVLASKTDPDSYEKWEEEVREANPFKVIPLVHVKNLDTDDLMGVGDLWELYDVIDDLNLVWYQMKRSNQFDSELNPIFIDAELDEEDLDKPAAPGEGISVKTVDGAQDQAQVLFPKGGNNLRPALMEYARELRKQIEEAAGASSLDQAEITNKGNLTQAVLTQLYQVLIETIGEKRKSYGQNGIELFLEKIAVALQGHGLALGVNEKDADSFDVQIGWPEHFELSEEEKASKVSRFQEEVTSRFTTPERAAEAVAQMEGVRDIPELLEELKKLPKPSPTEDDPNTGKPGPDSSNADDAD